MTVKKKRPIIIIDEEKCDGCGICVPSCAEGALQIINGKARLVSEIYCDGLGACLGKCPRGAITIEERLAADFDEEAAKAQTARKAEAQEPEIKGCPSALMSLFNSPQTPVELTKEDAAQPALPNWPVQLALVPSTAKFLHQADVLLVADCVPFACTGFHRDMVKGRPVLVACPKLDDYNARLDKLTDIFSQSEVKSVSVIKMEVPCCSNLAHMARQAIQAAGKEIPVEETTVSIKGAVLE